MILLCAGAIGACGQDNGGDGETGETAAALGVNLDNMDRDVSPREDFFRYVNGTWLEETEIPADRSRYGSFDELREQAEEDLRVLVQDVSGAEDVEPGSARQMIRDFYRSYMDEERAAELGVSPVADLLDEVAGIESRQQLQAAFARLPSEGVGGPFAFYVRQDARNSDEYISYLSQSGLGLPDRSYYVEDDNADMLEQYAAHVERMLELSGHESPGEAARAVVSLETALAENQWTRVENRDPVKTYNRKTLAELSELAPGLDWQAMVETAGAEDIESVVVRQPDYLAALPGILEEVALSDWRDYLHWRIIDRYAGLLSPEFVEADFEFKGRTLQGKEEPRPRWKEAIDTLDSVVGFQLGKLYVERHYDEQASRRMEALVDNLMVAFEETLRESPWMSEATRAEALDKLDNFNTKIGYPEKWRSYEGLEIRPDDLVGNYRRSRQYEYERMLDRLGEPVDRDEWFMTPHTVNAYYSPQMTEIVFPAAILQPPFFNVEADDAVNYGAIGAVIGHEISHGFDDSGRRVDGAGNLRDWWSADSEAEFQDRAQVLVDQFDRFEPIEGRTVNGELTLGENIGDHGGLRVAWRAYQHSLDGEAAPEIEGFTGAQRFFLGWGQIWRIAYRDEAMKQYLQTDSHSPGEYRVNGALPNIPGFYEAFEPQPGDGMYLPESERADIW